MPRETKPQDTIDSNSPDERGPVSLHDVKKRAWKNFKKLAAVNERTLPEQFEAMVRKGMTEAGLPYDTPASQE